MTAIKKTFQYGDHEITLETGAIARQASGAVIVRMGETVLLVTAVGVKETSGEARDFFPLTINYQEKTYAAGKIPGGYFKREGRPTEFETLTSRLIDRPIRPLFPEGYTNEVQVIATLMSHDPEVGADVPALIGASAALAISGMPFKGPLGAARVGYKNSEYLLNPSKEALEESELDLVVAGTANAVLMVESEAKELPEDIMLGAVVFGHEQMQIVINAINELAAEVGNPAWEWQAPVVDVAFKEKVATIAKQPLTEAYQIREKVQRQERIAAIRDELNAQLSPGEDSEYSADDVAKLFKKLEKDIVRGNILAGDARIDGRDTNTVRPINVETGFLPRAHGSAVFTRGETQAIVVATLGTGRDAQLIDALSGEQKDQFMLHYNFPPYSVGECGFMSGPKRREIGHGRLARRGVQAVLPQGDDYPYVLRVVSEITESNGSSSMASVCGTSLALMDAGVPIKAPVAGIAMGLIKEADKFAVLTDILGDEDHLGDMDFKVAGTGDGVTALQMDIKIDGITKEIMETALSQAKDARMHILGIMNQAIEQPRENLSQYAPVITTIKINPDKIRDVIGKGGAVIRSITEETGAVIDIDDTGIVNIAATNQASGDAAYNRIKLITAEVEVGTIYDGRVEKLMDFGAFVNILPGKDGLVHISQICHERVNKVSDKLSEGQTVKVKVLEVDRQGRIKLSMKDISQEEAEVS